MSPPVISVEQLSKAYRIGLKEEIPDTLVSALTGFVKAPLRNFRRLHRLDTSRNAAEDDDTFWALRDVSFEVKEGEVLGVIGRNGAGKSTLLKILSRITEPTSGRAVIRGRVSSLLEVGTGFHPELSGRENVYLNGTILGMTKAEIDRKFDEIVDFSGVEKFLDTPVKRYSSGMKVRLAFAVAAHLDPEILIIDEVLAVGDAEFQKKCMGKMKAVATGGRTVLFVSHNMAAVQALCTRAIILDGGSKVIDGSSAAAVEQYLASSAVRHSQQRIIQADAALRLLEACLVVDDGDIVAKISFETLVRYPRLGIGFEIRTPEGLLVSTQGAIHSNSYLPPTEGLCNAELRLRDCIKRLNGGDYRLNVWISSPGVEKLLEIEPLGEFEVAAKDPSGFGKAMLHKKHGPLYLDVVLSLDEAPAGSTHASI